ncbi:MAG: MBL fold metallo-hydrolase [Brevinema sp.]
MHQINKISFDIYQFRGRKPSAHSYLLKGKKNILVDTGSRESFDVLQNNLKYFNLDISSIDMVILTHCHYDHSGAIEYFAHAEILCHPLCYEALINKDESAIYALKYGYDLPKLPQNIKLLYENKIISHGNQQWRVFFTPGHSIDGICLLEEKTGILITGDTLFAKGIPASITHSGSESSLLYSIKKLETKKITMILPGHGIIDHLPQQSIIDTKKNIIMRIKQIHHIIKNGDNT